MRSSHDLPAIQENHHIPGAPAIDVHEEITDETLIDGIAQAKLRPRQTALLSPKSPEGQRMSGLPGVGLLESSLDVRNRLRLALIY